MNHISRRLKKTPHNRYSEFFLFFFICFPAWVEKGTGGERGFFLKNFIGVFLLAFIVNQFYFLFFILK